MDNLELYHAARRAYWFGRYNRAVEFCARADFHKCDNLRARILNPDERYTKILARYHRRHKPRCYLEIGVDEGTTLRLSGAQTTVGVDPAPQCEGPGTLYKMTSDQFFEKHGPQYAPDMAFIDGSHRFEDALRDFINLERIMNPRGVIFIHDALPLDERTATKERHTQFWSGDIWRLFLLLWEKRTDLSFHLFRSPPTGLLRVSRLNKGACPLQHDYTQLVREYNEVPCAARIR